jgi:hypothetical protein
LNPHDLLRSADFKSAASADFAIRACVSSSYLKAGASRSGLVGDFLHTFWLSFLTQAAVSASAFSRSELKWVISASTTGCSLPSITSVSWCSVNPMRWSVSRFCGKL